MNLLIDIFLFIKPLLTAETQYAGLEENTDVDLNRNVDAIVHHYEPSSIGHFHVIQNPAVVGRQSKVVSPVAIGFSFWRNLVERLKPSLVGFCLIHFAVLIHCRTT